jgi:hypothetical protein
MTERQPGPVPSGLDRYYILTDGRSAPTAAVASLDVATLIIARSAPEPGSRPEHDAILKTCRDPLSVAELGAYLELPFNVLAVLVADLLDTGGVEARDPIAGTRDGRPDLALLEEVLSGLQRL